MIRAAFLFLLLAAGTARAQEPATWHLMQKRADGSVVAEGLSAVMTKKECEFARARILGEPATDEEKTAYAATEKERWWTPCPPTKSTTEQIDQWMYEHPLAEQCVTPDIGYGHGSMSWSGMGGNGVRTFSPHDIMTAECFQ